MTHAIWPLIASGVSVLIALALEIALLVISLVVVRRHRPDAWAWFALAAGVQLLSTISTLFGSALAPMLVAQVRGPEALLQWNAAMTVGRTMLSAIGTLFLLFAIVQLARPPKLQAPGGAFSNLEP